MDLKIEVPDVARTVECGHLRLKRRFEVERAVFTCLDCGFQFSHKVAKARNKGSWVDMYDGKRPILITGYLGFGDQFWTRPIVRKISKRYGDVWVHTSNPEMWWDCPKIHPVRAYTNLRTCKEAAEAADTKLWNEVPRDYASVSIDYELAYRHESQTIMTALERAMPLGAEVDFHFPLKPEWVDAARKVTSTVRKPIALIKQGTVRAEWQNPARSCKDEYLQRCIDRHKEFHWILVGNNRPQVEWPEGELQNIDCRWDTGQVELYTMLGLVGISAFTLASQCYMLPASLAIGTPTFTIWGGWVHPRCVVDPRLGLERLYGEAVPDPYCAHDGPEFSPSAALHNCRKDIQAEVLDQNFDEFLDRCVRPRLAGLAADAGKV
jgi:hypothetical protein